MRAGAIRPAKALGDPMPFDQPRSPSHSIVPPPERVAAYVASRRARVTEELTAASASAQATKPGPVPQLISGVDNTYNAPGWVWPDRIARGKLTVLGGVAGSGTSAFVTDVIARVTAGSAWPCQEGVAPKGAVLLIEPHGDPDVFGLRFRAAGGDRALLHTLREVKDGTKARPFDLEKDLALLDPLIAGIKELRLIAIDAVQVAGGRGPAAARKTDALLHSLAALARRHDVAVLAVTRQTGADYLNRRPLSFATLPLTAARTAFLVEIDPNDEGRRVLLQVKNELSNDSGTLSFAIVRRENAAAITFAPAKPRVRPHEISAPDARAFNSAKAEAIEFLRGLFSKTTHLKVIDVEAEAREAGLMKRDQAISQCRALRDARLALGLSVIRGGFGPGGSWVWAKPDAGEADKPEPQPQAIMPAPAVPSPPIQPAQAQAESTAG